MTEGLNRRHQALLDYIKENPGQTALQIADYFINQGDESLQATVNATRCALRRLMAKGLIEYKTTMRDRQFPKYHPIL